jgi:hypothetical protein
MVSVAAKRHEKLISAFVFFSISQRYLVRLCSSSPSWTSLEHNAASIESKKYPLFSSFDEPFVRILPLSNNRECVFAKARAFANSGARQLEAPVIIDLG